MYKIKTQYSHFLDFLVNFRKSLSFFVCRDILLWLENVQLADFQHKLAYTSTILHALRCVYFNEASLKSGTSQVAWFSTNQPTQAQFCMDSVLHTFPCLILSMSDWHSTLLGSFLLYAPKPSYSMYCTSNRPLISLAHECA